MRFFIISHFPSEVVCAVPCRPELCAQTCVYLASGKAGELRGRYINSESDIDSVVKQAEIVKKANLYDLGIRELGEFGQEDKVSARLKDLMEG